MVVLGNNYLLRFSLNGSCTYSLFPWQYIGDGSTWLTGFVLQVTLNYVTIILGTVTGT